MSSSEKNLPEDEQNQNRKQVAENTAENSDAKLDFSDDLYDSLKTKVDFDPNQQVEFLEAEQLHKKTYSSPVKPQKTVAKLSPEQQLRHTTYQSVEHQSQDLDFEQIPQSELDTDYEQKAESTSIVRSSAVMFAGTLISRVLGLVRSSMLLATLGALGANDAFNVANTLPNTIFNLLAGGVLNAILVPQIVRALRKKDGTDFVNKLLTTAGALLLVITTIATAGSSILVALFAYNMDSQWRALAVSFAFWCMPQIFFYGLYVLYGQVLNARYSFGPYMWAPILNNVISIAGLGLFIYFFGFASPETTGQYSFWTWDKIALIAGTGTLGIVLQALVLLPFIKRTGFKLRITFKGKASGLGHASRMAFWAFGVVAISQIEILLISNIASWAGSYSTPENFVPSVTVYNFAYLIYMIPQSLVTTSVITALFTKLSHQAASGKNEQMAQDYYKTVTCLGAISVFCSFGMSALSQPLAMLIGPSRPLYEVNAIAFILSIMCICIPFQALYTINTRVLFAYEKTRIAFFFEIPRTLLLSVFAMGICLIATPKFWVGLFCYASILAFMLICLIHCVYLKKKFAPIPYSKILLSYLRQYLAMAVVTWLASTASSLLFASPTDQQSTWEHFSQSFLHISVIGTLMLILYVLALYLLKAPEITSLKPLFNKVLSRLKKS